MEVESYKSRFFENLYEELKLNRFYDVHIICSDGSKFGAHKIILSSSCAYFKSMFDCGLIENFNNNVCIQNVGPKVFKKILNFIYSGQIELDEETVQNVLIAADYFGLTEVFNQCCDFLCDQLNPFNVIGINELSRQCGFKSLENVSGLYMRVNFSEVMGGEEFFEMPFDTLQHCLSENDLCVKSEQQLFEACMKWVGHNVKVRRVHLEHLCTLIRLPLLSLNFLKEFYSNCRYDIIKSHINHLVDDLLNCHQVSSIKLSSTLISVCSISRKIVGATAYIVGGIQSRQWSDPKTFNSILFFDSTLQRFSSNHDSPSVYLNEARSNHCVAVVDRKVFIFGGERCLLMVDRVECWEPHKESCDVVSMMPTQRVMAGACAVSNLVYLFGGQTESRVVERKVDVFNTWTNSWQESKVFPDHLNPCYSQGVIYHEGLVYLLGGIDDNGRIVRSCLAYNPVTDVFENITPLQTGRAQFGIALMNDHIYIAGGCNKWNRALTDVERYSILQNKWENVSPLNEGRYNACMACLGDRLYVFGGERVNGVFLAETLSSMEKYDATLDEWSLVDSADCARATACVAVM